MSKKTNQVMIESNKRFSELEIWKSQKAYYDAKGIEAFAEDVPFYITSNPFIGRSYAELILSFIQNWIQKNPVAEKEIFYILELGTGTGQFSFYVLTYLKELLDHAYLKNIKIKYIMSDISARSFEFWETHVALKPFFESNMLDFATYDLYQNSDIVLHREKTVLSKNSIQNPLILIANYLFDSIATDVFTAEDGKLYENKASIFTEASNIQNGNIVHLEKIKIDYHQKVIADRYYHNDFDSILFDYQKKLTDSHFQFPVAVLNALKNIRALSNQKLLLLTSDKAYSNCGELDHIDYPDLDFHGSFSVMVNYHAIGEYLKKSGGEYVVQAFRENIATGIFSSGFALSELPQFKFSATQAINGFSPTDYFMLYEHFIENYKNCSLAVLASYLNLSVWDPGLFDTISDHLSLLAEKGDPEVVAYLSENMHRIAAHFYYLPSSNDILFDIGVYFQNIGHYSEAIQYYERSKFYYGINEVVEFNIGMCFYSLDQLEKALIYMKTALQLNSKSIDTKKWIETIDKKLNHQSSIGK